MVLNFFSQLLSTGCIVNIMLQGVKRDCRGIQGVTRGLQGLIKGYTGLQEVTWG